MKIEVSKHGALLAAVCALLAASIVLVSAYNNPVSPQSNPSYVGHSVDEIDWTQSVPQLKAVGGVSAQDNVTAPKICIGADCRTAWPVGGAVLPAGNTCPVGQYVKGLNTDGTVICGAPPCNPLTQTVACSGKNCGYVSDGCSGTYTCGTGTCSSGYTCTNNVCVCTPIPFATACSGKNCGTVNNGCGGTYTCGTGTCSSGYACTNNVCVCSPIPQATACSGKNCGTVSNGCGGSYTCGSGSCSSGQVCSNNVCRTLGWTYIGTTSYTLRTIQGAHMYPTSITGYDPGYSTLLVSTVTKSEALSPSNIFVNYNSAGNVPPVQYQATGSCSGSCSSGQFCVIGGTAKPAIGCDGVRYCPTEYWFYSDNSNGIGQDVDYRYNMVNAAGVYRCQ